MTNKVENVAQGSTLSVTSKNYRNGNYESGSTTNTWVDSFTKYRSWYVGPKPWKSTRSYVNARAQSWPQAFLITENTPSYATYSERSGTCFPKISWVQNLPFAFDIGDALTQAQNACFDLAAGQQFATPVFVAEMGKTVELIAALAQKANQGWKLLRQARRNPSGAVRKMRQIFGGTLSGKRLPKHHSGELASAWLVYRYGIMTGVMDVEDLAKTAASMLLSNKPQEIPIRANRTVVQGERVESYSYGYWDPPFLLHQSAGGGLSWKAETTHYAKVSAWLKLTVQNQSVHEMNQWGLLNWPSSIWELIPGSFIADWALDIGNYLDRCSALAGYQVVDSGYSVYRYASGEISGHISSDYWTNRTLTGEKVSVEASHYSRHTWPNPAPVWTPKVLLTGKRLLDAAALFRNIPLGRFRI